MVQEKLITAAISWLSLLGLGAIRGYELDPGFYIPIHGLCTLAALLVFNRPIRQDQDYHNFAGDGPSGCGHNALNVNSNVGFFVVGLGGLLLTGDPLWACVIGVSFGSAYYHLRPTYDTLFWDRAPMAAGFACASMDIAMKLRLVEIPPLVYATVATLALLTVVWWYVLDDLRPYAFVQFYTIALSVYCCTYNEEDIESLYYASGFYIMAKIAEWLDHEIYNCFPISGHVLKHLLSAVSLGMLLEYLR